MRNYFRSAPALLIAISTAACMQELPTYGAFPTADEDVVSRVTKDEAAVIGAVALDGLASGDMGQWTTNWKPDFRDQLDDETFQWIRGNLLGEYGAYQGMTETRVVAANTPGYVRFSFLAEFDNGALMLAHIYPEDGDQITGVHIRDAETGEIPSSIQP